MDDIHNKSVSKEFERMGKEAYVAGFKALSQALHDRTEELSEKPEVRIGLYHGQGANWAPS